MNRIPLPLLRHAREQPRRAALVTDAGTLTFARLAALADATAHRLAREGVGPGDRVAVCSRQAGVNAVLLHAVARLDGVLCPLDPGQSPAGLATLLATVQPRAVVWLPEPGPEARVPGASHLVAPGPPSEADGLDLAPAPAEPAPSRPRQLPLQPAEPDLHVVPPALEVSLRDAVAIDAPYTMVFTSGTTGGARAAVLTHGNHLWSALGSALRLGCLPDDRWLAPLGAHHVAGLAVLLRTALYGITAQMPDRFDAGAVGRALADDDVTIVSLVPTMLHRLLELWADAPAPPGLRAVLLGGAPAPRALLERAAAGGWPVALTYGLTEAASQVATAAPARSLAEPALPPLPFVRVRVLADCGTDADAADGALGEIAVSGPTVMAGYWSADAAASRVAAASGSAVVNRDPDADHGARDQSGGTVAGDLAADGEGTADRGAASGRRAGPDGQRWWRTGDLGRLDASGRLTVLGRRDDLVITGGENVAPHDVEAVLDAHPAVAESCVVGLTDPEWGQRLVAALVPTPVTGGPSVDPVEVLAFARERLARYQVPREAVWWSAPLPRTSSGKLLRSEVAAALAAGP